MRHEETKPAQQIPIFPQGEQKERLFTQAYEICKLIDNGELSEDDMAIASALEERGITGSQQYAVWLLVTEWQRCPFAPHTVCTLALNKVIEKETGWRCWVARFCFWLLRRRK